MCHESGYPRTGRDFNQPCFCQNETEPYYPHRNQPTQALSYLHAMTWRIRFVPSSSWQAADVTFGEGYPGWKPNPHSAILEVAAESYKRLFGVEAKVKAIHAGLECGLFLDKYPTLDMISFGPTLTGVHSPDERMHIPSVEKFWKHLLDILAHVPAKK
ncbi:M20/M25/M40 family metallo-hydrolase [Bacteroides thetaiotaomicron]|nr:M20/M25/M40 family metallo-hydrolase [Bacteroides thetaiotaomicron]